jgi:hypothetical protein
MKEFTFLMVLLFFIFNSFNLNAGGVHNKSQKISYKVISYQDGKTHIPQAFIKRANMMIVMTMNERNELIYMDNRWVNYESSSYGELVKTAIKNQYLWNPTNTYNDEHNACVVTTYEKIGKSKSIRTFHINVNHGKEKLVIVAERM